MIKHLFLSLVAVCSPLIAQPLDVVVGWPKPPYVAASQVGGFEPELAAIILSELGHQTNMISVPFARSLIIAREGQAAVVLTVSAEHGIEPGLLTQPYVIYQNVAITLSSRNIELNRVGDLSRYSVVAFQTARNVLGSEFADSVNRAKGYLEIPEQFRQVKMLMFGSVDVAVMDRNIFNYFKSQLPLAQQADTTVHEIFDISPYSAAIQDQTLRVQFNQSLDALKADGRYQALLKKHGLVDLSDKMAEQVRQD